MRDFFEFLLENQPPEWLCSVQDELENLGKCVMRLAYIPPPVADWEPKAKWLREQFQHFLKSGISSAPVLVNDHNPVPPTNLCKQSTLMKFFKTVDLNNLPPGLSRPELAPVKLAQEVDVHVDKVCGIVSCENSLEERDVATIVLDSSTDVDEEVQFVEKPKRRNGSKTYEGKRREIVEFCKTNGSAATMKTYEVPSSTLNDWMKKDLKGEDLDKKSQLKKKLLPDYVEKELLTFIADLRDTGQLVTGDTVVTFALVLIRKHGLEGLLKEHGGKRVVSADWGRKRLKKNGYSRRAATQSKSKKDTTDEIRKKFLGKLALNVATYSIPPEMVVNWDETGLNLSPSGTHTYARKGMLNPEPVLIIGSMQVKVVGFGDKRQGFGENFSIQKVFGF